MSVTLPHRDFKGHRLSVHCWNGHHRPLLNCTGWVDVPEEKKGKPFQVAERCECPCHDERPRRRPKKDMSAQMDVAESGCGTIEVK